MTQTKSILNYLQKGFSITPLEALDKFGCFRLGARIHDIKELGYDVQSKIVRSGKKHYAKYWLKKTTGQPTLFI
jgi:hypothetical protein